MKKTIGHLICRICKKEFIPKNKYGKNYYCSKKCYGIAVMGSKHPGVGEKISKTKKAKGVYIDFVCEVCKKQIKFSISHAKGRRTCSRRCAGKLNSDRLKIMWINPPQEMIEKMRTKMIQRRSKGRIEKETKPERIFREELERRNIIFESQFGFGGMMIADFFIPRLQAFIFIDGSYWHSLPSSLEKDKQQVIYARSKGMKAYRFSDKQVFKNVSKCLNTILEDADQPFSFAEVIDKLTILAIKTQIIKGDKLKQVLRDYRRMETVVISGLEYYSVKNSKEVLKLLKELSILNIKIFMEMEKDDGDLQIVKKLNRQRSDIKNAMNSYFNEDVEIKTYE